MALLPCCSHLLCRPQAVPVHCYIHQWIRCGVPHMRAAAVPPARCTQMHHNHCMPPCTMHSAPQVNNKLVALLPKLPALKELHLPAPASHAPRLNQCTPQGLHMLLPALPALTSLHLTTPNLELHGREAVRHASPSPASHPTIIKALGSRSRLMALSLHALAEPDAKAAAACGSGRDSLSGRPSACGSGMPDILVSAHGVVVQLPAAGPVVAALGSFTALTQLTYLSLSPHVFHSYSDGGLSHAASQLSLAQFTDACMGDVAPPYSPATSAHLVTPATFLMSGAGAMPPLNAFAPPSPTLHATSPTKHVTSPTLHGTSSNSSSLLGGIPALGAMAVGGAASQAVYRISSGSLGLFDRMGTGLSITSREATPPTSPLPHPISRTGTGTLSHAGSVLLPTAARLGLLVTDGLVAELCGSLKHLVALELMDCWELGAAGLAAIASNLPVGDVGPCCDVIMWTNQLVHGHQQAARRCAQGIKLQAPVLQVSSTNSTFHC